MEDNQNGRQPDWKMKKWKTTKMEDDQTERRPKWNLPKMEVNQNRLTYQLYCNQPIS